MEMSEYISREAANEACREAVRRYPNSFYNGIEAARDVIRKLPAADVRPVVTCGECKLMYDELVKRLRKEAGEWCANCCYKCGDNVCGAPDDRKKDCDVYTKLHAADAIEELQKAVNFHKFNSEFWEDKYNSLTDEKWIPVEERLPRPWWPVLGLMQFNDKAEPPAQQVLWYLGNGHWRETWKGDMVDCNVTHWMPLPEPPKEE